MTGDTKYSELAGDETVMEITLQAQWERGGTYRDTGTHRDTGTYRRRRRNPQ